MAGIISVNMQKIKATASVNRLIGENFRSEEDADRYDDGHRMIDTGKTGDNVFLTPRPDNYDAIRRDRIKSINDRREARRYESPESVALSLPNVQKRLKANNEYKAAKNRQTAATRKLRVDTVDTLGIVIQPSADYINSMDRDMQTRFFADALAILQDNPEWFGRVETAVIHYDENTPHMQCLASTLNEDTLTSDAKAIMGSKTKMSNRQTFLAEEMQKKGWDVERGMKRVNNPDYVNFKSEVEAAGLKVNRHNDAALMAQWEQIKNERDSVQSDKEKLKKAYEAVVERAKGDARKIIQTANNKSQAIMADVELKRAEADKCLSAAKKALESANTQSEGIKKDRQRLSAWEKDLQSREAALSDRETAVSKKYDGVVEILGTINIRGRHMSQAEADRKARVLRPHLPLSEKTPDKELRDLTKDLQEIGKEYTLTSEDIADLSCDDGLSL